MFLLWTVVFVIKGLQTVECCSLSGSFMNVMNYPGYPYLHRVKAMNSFKSVSKTRYWLSAPKLRRRGSFERPFPMRTKESIRFMLSSMRVYTMFFRRWVIGTLFQDFFCLRILYNLILAAFRDWSGSTKFSLGDSVHLVMEEKNKGRCQSLEKAWYLYHSGAE